jgi:hypothetical protein
MTAPLSISTVAELDRMILAAAQNFTRALMTQPRDQQRINDARLALAELRSLRTELFPNG